MTITFTGVRGRLIPAAVLPVVIALLLPGLPSTAEDRPEITSIDIGLSSGFQDIHPDGHFERGRALVAADFDLDGRVDFYVGNPGDTNYILHNVPDGSGRPTFERLQSPDLVAMNGEVTWSATSLDYDNDGDYDIFVPIGGNEVLGPPGEGIGFNHLLRNTWITEGRVTGVLSFEDVTEEAGVAGPIPPGETEPIPVAGAGAVAGDYNLDGWTDIYQSVQNLADTLPQLAGRDILWKNDGDGTFTDMTEEVGLGASAGGTQHSSFLDYDNDGDLDVYMNNWNGFNYMGQNLLKETGVARFKDVTDALSPEGEDLHYPWESFASAPADFNGDGWQDLLVFDRWQNGEPGSPYWPDRFGHAIFINQGVDHRGTHRGFVNVGRGSGINADFQHKKGAMGCQIGDVNGDGAPDVYVGDGAPMDTSDPLGGQYDQLLLSTNGPLELPTFSNGTALIDYPAPKDPSLRYPPYPYRTHGVAIVDVDGDGTQEVAVTEGGPSASRDYVREPDRLFKFLFSPTAPNWLIVHPVGDGNTVSSDAVGTRFALTVRNGSREWTVHRTLFGGSCFSAHNGYDVHFGLASATEIVSLEIIWPDGTVETRTEGLSINTKIQVSRASMQGELSDSPHHVASDTAERTAAFMAAHPAPAYSLTPPPITDPRLNCGG
jgi:hypothetical protein